MIARRSRWSMPTAFAVAWVLVLQSLLGAFAAGAGPNPAQLDAFGNVICTHDGTAQLPPGDQPQQHQQSCCVLGCTMFSTAFGAPPETVALFNDLALVASAVVFPTAVVFGFDRDWSPGNPRAPPVVA